MRAFSQIVKLSGETFINEPPLTSCERFELGIDLLEDLVVQARDRWEQCRLESLAVIDQFKRITLEETDLRTCH